ncbi:hypothetical protein ACFLYY_00735 [Patescibacteria group bacterium]
MKSTRAIKSKYQIPETEIKKIQRPKTNLEIQLERYPDFPENLWKQIGENDEIKSRRINHYATCEREKWIWEIKHNPKPITLQEFQRTSEKEEKRKNHSRRLKDINSI